VPQKTPLSDHAWPSLAGDDIQSPSIALTGIHGLFGFGWKFEKKSLVTANA
jgi:hypothetical protein